MDVRIYCTVHYLLIDCSIDLLCLSSFHDHLPWHKIFNTYGLLMSVICSWGCGFRSHLVQSFSLSLSDCPILWLLSARCWDACHCSLPSHLLSYWLAVLIIHPFKSICHNFRSSIPIAPSPSCSIGRATVSDPWGLAFKPYNLISMHLITCISAHKCCLGGNAHAKTDKADNLTISHVMVYSDVIALIYFSCCHPLHKILEVPKCQKRCIEFCFNCQCWSSFSLKKTLGDTLLWQACTCGHFTLKCTIMCE